MIPIIPRPEEAGRHVIELVGVARPARVRDVDLAPALASIEPGTRLRLGDAGTFTLVSPFEPLSGRGRWQATARLHGRGPRLVPYATVEITTEPWSRDACDVHLRPLARAPHAWGARRLRRYLDLAVRAAEALTAHIETVEGVPRVRRHDRGTPTAATAVAAAAAASHEAA